MPESDPRVFFAAERTLLAWVRTGLALIGMGFVVARFGLFLRVVRHDAPDVSHPAAPWVGIGLAVLGAVATAVAARQHQRFYRTLGPADLPPGYRVEPGLVVGYGVAIAGLALAGYLAV